MARIAGVDLPRDKRVVVSLTYIYGIGRPTAEQILAKTGISEDIRVKDLTDEQINAIRNEVDSIKVEGDLRREVALNIKRLMEIGATAESVTVKVYRFADREQKQMLVRVKVQFVQ